MFSSVQYDFAYCSVFFCILQTIKVPQSNVGDTYYKMKLAMHNLTVFELGRNVGTCYTWTEHEHLRGPKDIATCVSKWLESKDSQGIKEVVLFSDSTVSQNRNGSFSTMTIHTLQTAVRSEEHTSELQSPVPISYAVFCLKKKKKKKHKN